MDHAAIIRYCTYCGLALPDDDMATLYFHGLDTEGPIIITLVLHRECANAIVAEQDEERVYDGE